MINLKTLQQQNRLKIFNSANDVALAAADHIEKSAERSITHHGLFKLVVAGGTTPLATYRLLTHIQTDWSKWVIYFGDERCLAQKHPERNSTMIAEAWLNHVDIPVQNTHPIQTELGVDIAAANYTHTIADIDKFDLVILGMGEDGHTASLFPGHNYQKDKLMVTELNAPKPPPQRVSMNHLTLSMSDEILFLVTGSSKRDAMQQWSEGVSLPVNQFDETTPCLLMTDKDAMDLR